MSSPMLGATPSTSVAASAQNEEENADEVKIFRTDVDDANNDEPLDDELAADKTDVAFEADTDLGERSAFSSTQQGGTTLTESQADIEMRQRAFAVLAGIQFPSPGYLLPFLRPPFSPLSPFYHTPLGQAAAASASLAAHFMQNSPSHAQLCAAAALSGSAFGIGNPFGAFGAAPVLQPIPTTAAGAFGAGRAQPSTPTSARLYGAGNSALNSPVSSMAAGLNGMSLNAAHRSNVYKSTNTTPKRNGATPYGLQSASSSSGIGGGQSLKTPKRERIEREEKPTHIKKPCNAFMWYMKMNRKRLLAEQGGQQIQSATINRRLGEEWQKLSKEEQQKYFQLASKEREEHQKLHPDWTARDNYAIKRNKKKKLREKSSENNDQKKCRARFGVENQAKWCKHCKRKKRCLNVRETDSPTHVVSSTTNPSGMGGPSGPKMMAPMTGSGAPLQALNSAAAAAAAVLGGGGPPSVGAHISSSSSTASSSLSRHLESPSSSGAMSVGKRTESNASSNFDGTSPPPAACSSSASSAASSSAQMAAAAAAAANPLGFLQSLQHHPQFTQFAHALAAGGLATPKAEHGGQSNGAFSANATPLAPNATRPRPNGADGIEMPKPTPTRLLAQLTPLVAQHQQEQHRSTQQQQQQHLSHQQQQQAQFFDNFGFGAINPNHNFMAYAAAAAFAPQNLK